MAYSLNYNTGRNYNYLKIIIDKNIKPLYIVDKRTEYKIEDNCLYIINKKNKNKEPIDIEFSQIELIGEYKEELDGVFNFSEACILDNEKK